MFADIIISSRQCYACLINIAQIYRPGQTAFKNNTMQFCSMGVLDVCTLSL